MTKFTENAGHIPDFLLADVKWHDLEFEAGADTVYVKVPMLAPEQCTQLSDKIKISSNNFLRQEKVSDIVELIDKAIERLLNRDDPFRIKAEQLLPIVTGFDKEMVRLSLTEYLKTFRKPQLLKFLNEDFPNPKILDEFQPAIKGGFAKAFGPNCLLHIWAGNVPGLPLWSFISGLLVKAGNIGKVSSSEPLFASWFAKILIEIEPKISDCLAILWWEGGKLEQENILLRAADVVLAYGGNDPLKQIQDRTPITTRYLPYGHKISFGVVSANVLDAQKSWSVAHNAANDIACYDQHGCYSPHIFFVEQGGHISPRDFAQYIANELSCFQEKFPRRSLTTNEAIEIAKWRNQQEVLALSQPDAEIFSDKDGAWTVCFSECPGKFSLSGLNRTIRVVSVSTLETIIPLILPYKKFLQTVGIAATPKELFQLSESLGRSGITRICALGTMTKPEAGWHHDGRYNLLDLITLTEIESSAETASEFFANYTD
ncbi:MAG: acyl-CoA reductase [Rhodospirillaceae bacterium]|nr:acyl-CoA reductase [Rhodospirillaceae bacterium]OUU16084.1 MAG: acyl-CoA reductase [Candidatus Endolissoclinum sp. TMED37]